MKKLNFIAVIFLFSLINLSVSYGNSLTTEQRLSYAREVLSQVLSKEVGLTLVEDSVSISNSYANLKFMNLIPGDQDAEVVTFSAIDGAGNRLTGWMYLHSSDESIPEEYRNKYIKSLKSVDGETRIEIQIEGPVDYHEPDIIKLNLEWVNR